MKTCGPAWAKLTEEEKQPYAEKAELSKQQFEKHMAEREKKGFFLFEDGTKSTDPVNKNRVAKGKAPKKSDDDESDEEEEKDEVV